MGWLWFTILFAKPYKISLGREHETLPNQPIFFVVPMICNSVIVVASAILISVLNISSIGSAVEFGLLVGIGYLLANTLNIAVNPNIPQPLFYGLISGAFHLICILAVSIILAAMK
jgi:hypothetical protein